MLNSHFWQTASMFAALMFYAAMEDRIKSTVGKYAARGDVWTIGYQKGYDRGFEEGRRLIPIAQFNGHHVRARGHHH